MPVYNVEKYINDALLSLSNQTDKNYELIIVNDGSTDQSEKILKRWILDNASLKIKLIKQKNQGLSVSRNIGMQMATGKYIFFMDSDDFIHPKFVEEIKGYMTEKPDIIRFLANTVNEDGNIIKRANVYKNVGLISADKAISENIAWSVAVWQSVFNRDFLIKHGILFFPHIFYEDQLFTPTAFVFSNTVFLSNKSLYYYRIRNNSIMTSVRKNCEICNSWSQISKEFGSLFLKIKRQGFSGVKYQFIKKCEQNALYMTGKFSSFSDFLMFNRKSVIPLNFLQLLKLLISKVNN